MTRGAYAREVISGAHVIVYSTDADSDRAFLRDVLGLDGIDIGGGWLVFGLPPSEVAVHPADDNDRHELFLLVDDVDAFVADMSARGVVCAAITEQSWGRLTNITLPSGGKIAVYQPKHPQPRG